MQNEFARLRCNFLHDVKFPRSLCQHSVFRAKICKSLQPLLFLSSKAESKMLVVVTIEKFLRDFLFLISGAEASDTMTWMSARFSSRSPRRR